MKNLSESDKEQLLEIANEIMNAVEDARSILSGTSYDDYAENYIFAQIEVCVAEGGGSYITRSKTLHDIATQDEDDDEYYGEDDE